VNAPAVMGLGSFSSQPYYLDSFTVTCNNPTRNSGLTVTVSLFINNAYQPFNTPTITLVDDQSIAFDAGPGLYIPAGSMVTPIINSQPANTVLISYRRNYISTTSQGDPLGILNVITTVGLGGQVNFFVTAPTPILPANPVYGCRIAIAVGAVPPPTWTSPSFCRINENSFSNGLNTTIYIPSSTVYSFSAWFINANTPPSMSATAFTGTFTTI
jgi:hypothetical protein